MASGSMPGIVEPSELAEILLSDDAKMKESTVIIDVRDDDFKGGNIKGAQNIASHVFSSMVNKIAEENKDKSLVVLHCMYSQQRGPRCARLLAKTMSTKFQDSKCKICYLRGGFIGWYSAFKKHKKSDVLIENLVKSEWEDD
mmetsp:Transcript_40723/g.66224  ORF Transcript_40723/g.66224 Transcript_40723/m.66224 type:complete len:142 (-) Transcript_40723:235-660(-)|eukprot:jgi/Bigna1/141493/aug1.63_g16201